MYETNHEMMNYDFIEGIEFEGLMPKAIEKIGGVGASEENVEFCGFKALGSDALEVIDNEKLFEGDEPQSSSE